MQEGRSHDCNGNNKNNAPSLAYGFSLLDMRRGGDGCQVHLGPSCARLLIFVLFRSV